MNTYIIGRLSFISHPPITPFSLSPMLRHLALNACSYGGKKAKKTNTEKLTVVDFIDYFLC